MNTNPTGNKQPEVREALEPCPFCGDTDVRYARSEDECSYIFCHECHCESPRFEQENGRMLAKRAWNTRVNTHAQMVAAPRAMLRVEGRLNAMQADLAYMQAWPVLKELADELRAARAALQTGEGA